MSATPKKSVITLNRVESYKKYHSKIYRLRQDAAVVLRDVRTSGLQNEYDKYVLPLMLNDDETLDLMYEYRKDLVEILSEKVENFDEDDLAMIYGRNVYPNVPAEIVERLKLAEGVEVMLKRVDLIFKWIYQKEVDDFTVNVIVTDVEL